MALISVHDSIINLCQLTLQYLKNGFQAPLADRLRIDNALEFISIAISEWSKKRDVELEFIQPGFPYQNSYIKRFN